MMNRQVFTLAAALLWAGAVAAEVPVQADKDADTCADGSKKVWVTGSAIKRCVEIYGNGSLDTPSPVYVIGRKEIGNTGRNTVSDVLKSYPALR